MRFFPVRSMSAKQDFRAHLAPARLAGSVRAASDTLARPRRQRTAGHRVRPSQGFAGFDGVPACRRANGVTT